VVFGNGVASVVGFGKGTTSVPRKTFNFCFRYRGRAALQRRAKRVESSWALAPEVVFVAGRLRQRIHAADSSLSKNPSSSNRTRTADTSTCTGSPAASTSSSDNTAQDQPEFDQPDFHRSPLLPPQARALSPPAPQSVPGSCPPTVPRAPAPCKCRSRFRSPQPSPHRAITPPDRSPPADCGSSSRP